MSDQGEHYAVPDIDTPRRRLSPIRNSNASYPTLTLSMDMDAPSTPSTGKLMPSPFSDAAPGSGINVQSEFCRSVYRA